MPGEYPFVRLEGNRAACAICLMDFDEPERKLRSKPQDAQEQAETQGAAGGEERHKEGDKEEGTAKLETVQEVQVGEVTEDDAERLKLEDAGEGPQPLRLMTCGHVFHASLFPVLCQNCTTMLTFLLCYRKRA